ncbi:hypothetical protein J2T13_003987 [Paenibacillus sp. DS2015]|uniref:S-layer homology domain-containing protein n=1 Tax=Paenibacillus sp. DS2015 TaxID=3373917 RepID=UPI003D1B004F
MKERISILLMTLIMVFTTITPGLVPRAEAAGGTVTKTYTATADTMELNGQAEYNGIYDHDGDAILYVGMSNNDGFVNVRNRMAASFNLGAPEGTVVSAELVLTVATVLRVPDHTLYMEARGSAANSLDHNFNGSFPSVDTTSPYTDKFTAQSTAEVPMGTYLQDQKITLNVKSSVDAFTDGSDRNVTFILNGNEADMDSGRFLFYSLEASNAAFRPKLVVTYETGPVNNPPTGAFTIVEGAATNTNTVNLSVTGSDPDAGDSVTHMRFADSVANLSAASWLPFSNTATFSLSGGDGSKTIYMQLMDSNNGVSSNSSQTILLDQTAPTGTIIINDGAAWTNSATVTLKGTYTDGSGSGTDQARLSNINGTWQTSWFNIADLNGRSWVLPAGEGAKTVYVQYKDKVNNSSSGVISNVIAVDTIAPDITNVVNNKAYNSTVSPQFTEGSGLLNGNPYTSGTTITQDGSYTLIVTDPAGNSATVSFKVDTIAPDVVGVANGGIYNTSKTITFNEGTATLNGAAFVNNTQVTIGGVYTLVVTDDAGNKTTVIFGIDKVAPIVTGIANNGNYKAAVKVSFNEGTAKLNGAPFASGTDIDQDGSYTLVVTDEVGNVTTVSFKIDTVAPTVSGVTAGGIYKAKVTPSFNEGMATLNGVAFTSGTDVVQDGVYTLVVTDAAGNVATVSFEVDKTAPVVTGVSDGDFYKTKVTVGFNEGTATLNGAPFAKDTEIDQDGVYRLVVIDAVGNVTTVGFVIDTVAPVVTGVSDGGAYKISKTLDYNEGTATLNGAAFTSGTEVTQEGIYTLVVTDPADNVTTVGFTIDKSAPVVTGVANNGIFTTKVTAEFNEGTATLNGVAYTSGTEIDQNDIYTLIVTDAAGNVTTISFTIDTLAPTITGVSEGGVYQSVSPEFNEGTGKLNGTTFVSGTEIVLEGDYTLVVTDTAGNATTVNFKIDNVAPMVTGITEGEIYKSVTPSFNEGTAKLNGTAYINGTEIDQDGTYTLVVTDAAGNATTIQFQIDATAPTGTVIIQAGAEWTNVTDVTLSLTSDDGNNGSGVVEMRFSSNGSDWGSWEPSAITKAWSPITGDGEKTVYVQFKDKAGNVSGTIHDVIKLDQTIPTGTIIINKGETTTSNKLVAVTLTSSDGAGSGVTEMRFSEDNLTWLNWENVLLAKNWSLKGSSGLKKLYVQFRDAAGNVSVANMASITYQESSGSNGGGSGSTGSTGSVPSVDAVISTGSKPENVAKVDVVISTGSNSENATKVDVNMVEGKKVTTVFLEEAQLQGLLNESSGKPVITITVLNHSDAVHWEMNAELLQSLVKKNAIIQVVTETAVYTLPLDQVSVNKWRNQLGANVPVRDMKIKVELINLPMSAFDNLVDEQISLVVPPVSFSIIGLYGDKDIELNQFDTFVERRIAIPAGMDLTRITTGVKLMSDGTIVHIPTKIVHEGGQDYANLNSMTNSTYGLIYNKKTFNDVSEHWADESINDLASRLIINGADEQRFLPDRDITRAEFMSIMIRALGLSSANKTFHFKDIEEKAWYHQAVQIGYSYGLVDGYSDGSFNPNEKITRQEAMVILSRAMKLVELNKEINVTKQQELINHFEDSEQLASWAYQATALTIEVGVIGGYKGELRPLHNITRAETAAIIQRLLQKAEFI